MIGSMPREGAERLPESAVVDATHRRTLLEYLEPVPTPSGTSSRDLVRRAIDFDAPPRIPYSFFRPLHSDFCELVFVEELLLGAPWGRPRREPGEIYTDEWGVTQKVSGGRWDQVVRHPLADLAEQSDHRLPDADAAARYSRLAPWAERARRAGKYCVGFDPVLLYERSCDLVGFEDLMIAPYAQPAYRAASP
jgi:hypothetical protein